MYGLGGQLLVLHDHGDWFIDPVQFSFDTSPHASMNRGQLDVDLVRYEQEFWPTPSI